MASFMMEISVASPSAGAEAVALLCSAVQPSKTFLLSRRTVALLNVTLASCVQPANVCAGRNSTPAGMLTDVNAVQFMNTPPST